MAYSTFIALICSSCLLVLYLSYYFGQWKKQPVVCTVSYTVGWLISLLFVVVLPLDISSTFCYQYGLAFDVTDNLTSASFYVDLHTLTLFWFIIYWISQLLTWIILPIMESYAGSGEFTFLGKLRSAIVDNAIIYGSYLLIFICVMIYLLVKRAIYFDTSSLKVLLITTSNTWGLLLVILFMGYGLVEVPRSILRTASPISRLRSRYFSLSKRYLEYVEDEEELNAVLSEVNNLNQQVEAEHPLRSRLDVIVSKTTSIGKSSFAGGPAARWVQRTRSGGGAGLDPASLTSRRLARLHERLKRAYHHCGRANALWLEALRQAASAEDVFKNFVATSSRVFERGPTPAVLSTYSSSSFWQQLTERCVWARSFEWYWRCRIQPFLLRALGVILAAVSLLVVWSECTFSVQEPRLSVVAAILHSHRAVKSYSLIAFVSFIFLGYQSFCVYFTAYRLRFFNYYRLVPNHHSDAISLIFYGYMLCRLTPSLCVNFLCLAHLDSHVLSSPAHTAISDNSSTSDIAKVINEATTANITDSVAGTVYYETAFTKFMGHLDVVSFIADGFNIYFPIVVVILCLMTFFNLGSRLLACLGMPQLIDPSFIDKRLPAGEDSAVEDSIEDGRMLLYRERTLGRTRRFARDGNTGVLTRRNEMERNVTSSTDFQSLAGKEDFREGQIFSPDQPIVEFSDEKMNAMFEINFPPRSVESEGFSRGQYTSLGGNERPIFSQVFSSLRLIFKPR